MASAGYASTEAVNVGTVLCVGQEDEPAVWSAMRSWSLSSFS